MPLVLAYYLNVVMSDLSGAGVVGHVNALEHVTFGSHAFPRRRLESALPNLNARTRAWVTVALGSRPCSKRGASSYRPSWLCFVRC